ncbi:MAG: SAM-dependent methyltransferase [Candidatus Binataceae bacterium]
MSNPFLELEDREAWGPGSFEMALPLVEAVGIESGMRVLEVGGGSGQIAVTLAKDWNVTVFTLEPWFGGEQIQARAQAAGVFDRVIALKTRAQNLRFAEATFDAVISIGSFEMIAEDRAAALAQMVRVAKIGARIGIAEPMCLPIPIPADIRELDRAGFTDSGGFEFHFRSVDWNADLFEQASLSVIERRYFPEAAKWWLEYSERVAEAERALIRADSGRWASLGIVVGEKRFSG